MIVLKGPDLPEIEKIRTYNAGRRNHTVFPEERRGREGWRKKSLESA